MSNVQSRRVYRTGIGPTQRAVVPSDGRHPLYRDALIWFGISLAGWGVIGLAVLAILGVL